MIVRYVVKSGGRIIDHAETLEKAKRRIPKELIKAKWFETEEEFQTALENAPEYTIEKEDIKADDRP